MKITISIWDNRLFPGFYESVLWNSDTEYYMNQNAEDKDYEYEIKDFDGYCKDVAEKCCDELTNCLYELDYKGKNIINSIDYKGLNSPKYYNYETDRLEVEVDFNYYELYRYMVDNKEHLSKYLKEYFTNCDGHISFIDNDVEKFLTEYWDRDNLNIQCAIEYYLIKNMDLDELFNAWVEIANEKQWEYAEEKKIK